MLESGSELCRSNLKRLCLAFIMWAVDHNGALPAAEKWSGDLKFYLGSPGILKCPAAPELECGYAYNTQVAGKKLDDIENPAATILMFESTTGKLNAADALKSIPKPGRHNGGNNFGFADGHVIWLRDDVDPAKL